MTVRSLLSAVAAAATMFAAPQAGAVTFVLNSTSAATAVGTEARKGFEIAAAYWSSMLRNTSTVTLNIGFTNLGASSIAQTVSGLTLQTNTAYFDALRSNATSTVDASAIGTLASLGNAVTPKVNAFNATNNGYVDTATRIDGDQSANNRFMGMNSSVAKAIGLTRDAAGRALPAIDGTVTFNSRLNFDFDASNGIASNALDFLGTAIHEFGHALGFISGVDAYDARTGTTLGTLEGSAIATQLDMFRYSAPDQLDWSTQGQAYFSIDGGTSQLYGDSRFEMGVRNGGRGRSASHFFDAPATAPEIGLMDPTSGFGQMGEVTALDIAAFDAIGWNTAFDANLDQGYRLSTANIYRHFASAVPSVPEPDTWIMMILGFGAVGGALRRRRPNAATAIACN